MDSFGDYLQEIGRVPLLTDQEEIYCSRQIQAWLQYVGGPEAAPAQVQRRGKGRHRKGRWQLHRARGARAERSKGRGSGAG